MSKLNYCRWVYDSEDGYWKIWSGAVPTSDVSEEWLYLINHPNFPNPEYNEEKHYTAACILPCGEYPIGRIHHSSRFKEE